MELVDSKKNNTFLTVIGILSVAIPVVVAILLFKPGKLSDMDVSFLPHLNAVLNSATAICLTVGYYFIKNRRNDLHKTMMITAFVLSSLFLVSYVIYHANSTHTNFPKDNPLKWVYYPLLISHILLAIVVVYFALRSMYFGLTKQNERHKKVSKWTFPIWLYVAVTGVIVYFMISPYYN